MSDFTIASNTAMCSVFSETKLSLLTTERSTLVLNDSSVDILDQLYVPNSKKYKRVHFSFDSGVLELVKILKKQLVKSMSSRQANVK